MRLGRRGESAVVGWGQIAIIFYILFMGVITVIYVYNMYDLKASETNIPEEAFTRVHLSRIFLASDCLAYEEGGRTYTWTMDWSRFANADKLSACLPYQYGERALNLTLIKESGEKRSIAHAAYAPRPDDIPLAHAVTIRDGPSTVAGTLVIRVGR